MKRGCRWGSARLSWKAEEAERVRLALDGRELDGIPVMVAVEDTQLVRPEPALQTLHRIMAGRKEQENRLVEPPTLVEHIRRVIAELGAAERGPASFASTLVHLGSS